MKGRTQVVIGDAQDYGSEHWLQYGDIAHPNTREKMIMLGIEQIVRVGPADFTAVQVCDRLNIKHPMINHYFGNRDTFMAEVQWWAYREWVKHVDRTFRAAPANPRKRLRTFIDGEIDWAKRMGGVHILIHYPMVSASTMQYLTEHHQAEMQKYFEYHLALITATVRDIQKKTVHPLDFDADSVPRFDLLKNPKYFLAATQISWSTHGLASWSSGKHVATQHIEDPKITSVTTKLAVDQMIKQILSIAEK